MKASTAFVIVAAVPNRESAEAVAIKQFDLDQEQRRRLLVSEGT